MCNATNCLWPIEDTEVDLPGYNFTCGSCGMSLDEDSDESLCLSCIMKITGNTSWESKSDD